MNRPPALQGKFHKLLEEAAAFFVVENNTPQQDRQALDRLRTSVLDLVSEAAKPSFERFLAYLLGGTRIETHYPLQAIRMACLIIQAVHKSPALQKVNREELVMAAFLADIGFRAAWLGHKGNHVEVTSQHLKEMEFRWFTPFMEKVILFHHRPAEDPSPHKIVSLVAEYLGLTFSMGVDRSISPLLSPAKAIETMIDGNSESAEGLKILLQALSAFPLGSWVQLNSGTVALVVGGHDPNPLRPTVGFYRRPADFQGAAGSPWQEVRLSEEMTNFIAREVAPTPVQQAVMNNPCLWIPGWEGASAIPEQQLIQSFQETAVPAAVSQDQEAVSSQTRVVEGLWSQPPRAEKPRPLPPPPRPPAPAEPAVPAPAPDVPQETAWQEQAKFSYALEKERSEKRVADVRLKYHHDEMQHLRQEWEQYVHQMEGVVEHLKTGMMESYRRENERYKTILDDLVKEMTPIGLPEALRRFKDLKREPSGPTLKKEPLPQPSHPGLQALADQIGQKLDLARKALLQIQEAFQQARSAAQDLLRQTQEDLRSLSSLILQPEWGAAGEKRAVQELERRWSLEVEPMESQLNHPETLTPVSVTELEMAWKTAGAMAEEARAAGQGPLSAEEAQQRIAYWTQELEPQLQERFSRAHQDITSGFEKISACRRVLARRRQAVQELRKIVVGQTALAHFSKGLALKEAGDPANAAASFEQALRLDPQFWEARASIGLCYWLQRDPRAIGEFEKALALNPGQSHLQRCLQLAREMSQA